MTRLEQVGQLSREILDKGVPDAMPLERDRIRAMPMMPMDPAKAVRMVRAFLVMRLLRLRERAVVKRMPVRRRVLSFTSVS